MIKIPHNSDCLCSGDNNHSKRLASDLVVLKQSVDDDENSDSSNDIQEHLIDDVANMDQNILSARGGAFDIVKRAPKFRKFK